MKKVKPGFITSGPDFISLNLKVSNRAQYGGIQVSFTFENMSVKSVCKVMSIIFCYSKVIVFNHMVLSIFIVDQLISAHHVWCGVGG